MKRNAVWEGKLWIGEISVEISAQLCSSDNVGNIHGRFSEQLDGDRTWCNRWTKSHEMAPWIRLCQINYFLNWGKNRQSRSANTGTNDS